MPILDGVIWTNHAIDRLKERKIPQKYALDTLRSPNASFPGREKGNIEYQKFFDNHLITLIVAKNDRHEDVVLSCWAEPPFAGSPDIQKKKNYWEYRKAGFFKRLWIDLKSIIGL